MSEISELKAQLARMEATIAKQGRELEFLKGALEQQLRFATIRAGGDDDLPTGKDALEDVKLNLKVAGLGLRNSGRFVHAAAARMRTPIKRSPRQRGRNLIIECTRDDTLRFATATPADPFELTGKVKV